MSEGNGCGRASLCDSYHETLGHRGGGEGEGRVIASGSNPFVKLGCSSWYLLLVYSVGNVQPIAIPVHPPMLPMQVPAAFRCLHERPVGARCVCGSRACLDGTVCPGTAEQGGHLPSCFRSPQAPANVVQWYVCVCARAVLLATVPSCRPCRCSALSPSPSPSLDYHVTSWYDETSLGQMDC